MTRHWPIVALLLLATSPNVSSRADEKGAISGEQIYGQQCASCHGAQGEGTEHYAQALIGDRSVLELARIISETMPEDAPEDCTGEDAERVAEYIWNAFYSPTAQVRNEAPRIELARLTVAQYQNSVADLIAGFRWQMNWSDQRGLKGEYYKSRRLNNKNRVLERQDAVIDFDFGTSTPDAEKIEPEEFSIGWSGSLLAPETAEYEFIIETENAARLWVNDRDVALIDAWVKSGDQREHRGSLYLVGGRAYHLRLEFFTYKEETASIKLKWKRPHRPAEIIPARFLSPDSWPETLVVTTPFPPDDRSYGYERADSVSKAWHEATAYAAVEVANYVAQHVDELAGTKADAGDRQQKVHDFARKFAERAFRRPLTDAEREFFVERFFKASEVPLEERIKQMVLLQLTSPRFLYREVLEQETPSDFRTAARLAFALWDSVPDRELWDAAAKGKLKTSEQVRQQAERMVGHVRTRSKVGQFFQQWLKLDHLHDLSKSPERFPDFDERIAADLRNSLELFLDDIVWGESSDYRRLLLSEEMYLNSRLAEFYQCELEAKEGFHKIALDAEQRAGILTHPFLLSGFAYYETSSPIHRGVFLARSILGRTLRPPPEAVSPLPPELHADLTTRERVILQTQPASCQTCHGMINPLGFSLEHYDAVGRFREEENGKPIDASGSYITRDGQTVQFAGVRQLAEYLAASPEAHAAFAEQLFHHLIKQSIRAYGPETVESLRDSFVAQNFNIRALLVEIASRAALAPVSASQAGDAAAETTAGG